MNIVRLLSLLSTQTTIVKRLDKKRERKKRFWIRPERTSAWWNGFVGEVAVPEEWRENFNMSQVSMILQEKQNACSFCGLRLCFMNVFKFTWIRVDAQKRFENGYVWTR